MHCSISYDKSVLIVIDMIRGFTDIGTFRSGYIKNIAKDIYNFSLRFKDVIAINDRHKVDDCEFKIYPYHCIENSEECEMCSELSDIEFTKILFKNSTNGFFAKGFLSSINKYIENDFDFVVCGCCVDICILQFCITFKGYLNSINKNLKIIVPSHLVETYDSEFHNRDKLKEMALNFMKDTGIILLNSEV